MALPEHVAAEGSSDVAAALIQPRSRLPAAFTRGSGHHAAARHRECVIFAQIAAEVAADDCLTRLIAKVEPPLLREWLTTWIETRVNLAQEPTRQLLNALTATHIEHEPWWQAFKENNRTRNHIAHEGEGVTGAQAAAGLTAVRQMVEHLTTLT